VKLPKKYLQYVRHICISIGLFLIAALLFNKLKQTYICFTSTYCTVCTSLESAAIKNRLFMYTDTQDTSVAYNKEYCKLCAYARACVPCAHTNKRAQKAIEMDNNK